MFAPILVTPPAAPSDALADAKTQLRVSGSGDDALITALIAAAVGALDGWSGILGRALMTQTWRQDFSCFSERLDLPLAPVASVTSVGYYDGDNTLQSVDASDWALLADGRGSYVRRLPTGTWPSVYDRPDPVRVTFVAGYGNWSDLPAPIRQAVILMTAKLYALAKADPILQVEVVEGVGRQEWRGGEALAGVIDGAAAALVAPYRRVGL